MEMVPGDGVKVNGPLGSLLTIFHMYNNIFHKLNTKGAFDVKTRNTWIVELRRDDRV